MASGFSSPLAPYDTAPRSASRGKRTGDVCKDNPLQATPRRKSFAPWAKPSERNRVHGTTTIIYRFTWDPTAWPIILPVLAYESAIGDTRKGPRGICSNIWPPS